MSLFSHYCDNGPPLPHHKIIPFPTTKLMIFNSHSAHYTIHMTLTYKQVACIIKEPKHKRHFTTCNDTTLVA